MSSPAVKVCVVGAGISGLSAAVHLVQQDCPPPPMHVSVVILESRDRIGGRMYTVQHELGGRRKPLDLGAQWIHGGSQRNTLYNLAEK